MPTLKNIFKILMVLSSLELFATPINGIYLELGAGLGIKDTIDTNKMFKYTYNKNYLAEIILGYQYENYRFELEQSYKKDTLYSHGTAISKGDLIQNTKMINTYVSHRKKKTLTSIGIGFGISTIKLNDVYTISMKDDNIFTSQAIYSVGYMFSDEFILTSKYTLRYMIESDNFKAKLDNLFTLNLRYIF